MTTAVLAIVALFVGFLIGVFCMCIFNGKSYEKGREDAIAEVKLLDALNGEDRSWYVQGD